jgi:putative ABC transport system ATP-binding protein
MKYKLEKRFIMKEKIIELKNISKVYADGENDKKVLNDINLTIEKGDYISIVGASGSGKSTLLNIIGCMDSASSGEYIFNGTDVTKLKASELDLFRRNNVAFIFQQFALMSHYTVEENVALPLKNMKLGGDEKKKRIDEALEKVNIKALKKKKVTKISGGEQQRTAIARAMVTGNPLILGDEPTGALDKKNGQELMNYFDEMHREGKTIIMVTHDLEVAARAERIIEISDGQIISER